MQPITVPGPPKKKRRVGILIGVGLMIGGIVFGIVLAVSGVRGMADTVDGYHRVPMSTGGTITLDEPGTYRIFLEYPGANDELAERPGGFVTVRGPGGGPIAVLPESHSESYSMSGHTGRLLGKFRAETAGSYTLRTISRDGAVAFGEVAVGRKGPLSGAAAIAGGILGGGFLFVVGAIVLIVAAVRRSRSNSPAAVGWGGGAPPVPGWGPSQQVPGAGWGGPAAPPPGSWGAPGQSWAPGPGQSWAPGPGQAPQQSPGPVWNPPPSPPPGTPPWGDAPPSSDG